MAIVTLAVMRESERQNERVILLDINVNNGASASAHSQRRAHLALTIRRIIMRINDDRPTTTMTTETGAAVVAVAVVAAIVLAAVDSGFTWVCNVICSWHALRLAVTFMSGHKNARPIDCRMFRRSTRGLPTRLPFLTFLRGKTF